MAEYKNIDARSLVISLNDFFNKSYETMEQGTLFTDLLSKIYKYYEYPKTENNGIPVSQKNSKYVIQSIFNRTCLFNTCFSMFDHNVFSLFIFDNDFRLGTLTKGGKLWREGDSVFYYSFYQKYSFPNSSTQENAPSLSKTIYKVDVSKKRREIVTEHKGSLILDWPGVGLILPPYSFGENRTLDIQTTMNPNIKFPAIKIFLAEKTVTSFSDTDVTKLKDWVGIYEQEWGVKYLESTLGLVSSVDMSDSAANKKDNPYVEIKISKDAKYDSITIDLPMFYSSEDALTNISIDSTSSEDNHTSIILTITT